MGRQSILKFKKIVAWAKKVRVDKRKSSCGFLSNKKDAKNRSLKKKVDFIIDKHPDNFSLDLFKQEYAFYSIDLFDVTEEGFIDYMYTFFQDKGMPAFAVAIREGSRVSHCYDVVRDIKWTFTKPLYEELVENSLYYAPPYLPLYGFMHQTKKWPMLSLTVMEWGNWRYANGIYWVPGKILPKDDAGEIKVQVEKWLRQLKLA